MNDPAGRERREERLEERLSRIEFDARHGNSRQRTKAHREATGYHSLFGERITAIEKRLEDSRIDNAERESLEAELEKALSRAKRMFDLIDLN